MRAGRSLEEAKALQQAYQTKRVFDDPNHPQYGPVRRMWVVLAQLDLLVSAERWSYDRHTTWDAWLAAQIVEYHNVPESRFQRELIGILLEGWAS